MTWYGEWVMLVLGFAQSIPTPLAIWTTVPLVVFVGLMGPPFAFCSCIAVLTSLYRRVRPSRYGMI